MEGIALEGAKDKDGYVFNAGSNLIAMRCAAPRASTTLTPRAGPSCHVTLTVDPTDTVKVALKAVIEQPSPSIASAFLAKASKPVGSEVLLSSPHVSMQATSFGTASPPPDSDVSSALRRFHGDLVPYYLCQHELQGMAVTAHPIPKDLPAAVAEADSSIAMDPDFAELAIPLMKKSRPSLAGVDDANIRVEMRPVAEVLKVACAARLVEGRSYVSLNELMYDDAFVHSLLNWQQQPSRQLTALLKWLFQEVSALHARSIVNLELSLKTIVYHPTSGWALLTEHVTPRRDTSAAKCGDIEALARILCFLCLPSHQRRTYQPHRFAELQADELLKLVGDVSDIKIVAAALLRDGPTAASIEDALSFHLWHPLSVHAQVLQDTKAVMRSMRLGGEDFDMHYNKLVLGPKNWCSVLGEELIPAVIKASREHVLRQVFAEYDFTSSASLLRFVANTVSHFEELELGLQITKAAFLDAVVTYFPALVPACYHFLAMYPTLHVSNRDCALVFDAIEGDVDAVHHIMHATLASYATEGCWKLEDLDQYSTPGTSTGDSLPGDLSEKWAPWNCKEGKTCGGLADATCTKWHDERELRFAQAHLCMEFMEGACRRAACPNAHGFSEIRGAMNDASPICWKWLEGRCRVPHCKYAHTFRRHHSASVRGSFDSRRGSMQRNRASMDSQSNGARGRASMDFSSNGQRGPRASVDGNAGAPRASFDGPRNNAPRARTSHESSRSGLSNTIQSGGPGAFFTSTQAGRPPTDNCGRASYAGNPPRMPPSDASGSNNNLVGIAPRSPGSVDGGSQRSSGTFSRPSSNVPVHDGHNNFAARRKASTSSRKSLDASGSRRASFGHSRASIEGSAGNDWKQQVPVLHGDASVNNFAIESALTQPSKFAGSAKGAAGPPSERRHAVW